MKTKLIQFFKTYRIVIWIFMQAMIIIALFLSLEFHFKKTGLIIVLLGSFCALVFSSLLFLSADWDIRKKDKEIETIKAEVEIIKSYYSRVDQRLDDVNMLRHELRNALDVLNLESENSKKYLTLTETFDKKVEKVSMHKYCENSLLNIIIGEKSNEAQLNETRFACKLNIPESIAMDETDLFSCFYNLLDNAVFANRKQVVADCEKYIELKAETIGSYLIIKQINTAFEKTNIKNDGEFGTTKELSSEHGFGLKIIKDICAKYDGQAEFEHKNNLFYSTLTFNINSAI